jgi:DNA invertase Pin-like site-specific DNA recombinase
MGSKIGYARVSTLEQNLDLQLRALKSAGCKEVFTDKVSGVKSDRPGLTRALTRLQPGDTLFVWRLDRLGRSMPHLVSVISDLKNKKIGFRSIQDGAIDTTTASGELIFNIFASLAQFERELIRERTHAGLKSARARGRLGGRRPVPVDHPKVRMAKKMGKDESMTINDICSTLKISRATYYRYLRL